MDNHKTASSMEHLIESFMRIKTLSTSGEIDRLCVDGVSVLLALSKECGLQNEVNEIKNRRIDPTM